MDDKAEDCLLCDPPRADQELGRVEVWSDERWRLSTLIEGEIGGFSFLEPRRHIPHITDLNGAEAQTLGPVLARMSSALQRATEAELVYIYVFGGGIPHLHIHLAPHRSGGPLNDQIVRGDFIEERLPSGATRFVSKDFPPLPEEHLVAVAEALRAELSGDSD
jgi:diadenosine tetraphosphate (Ap4A) HIT family hydrolase